MIQKILLKICKHKVQDKIKFYSIAKTFESSNASFLSLVLNKCMCTHVS